MTSRRGLFPIAFGLVASGLAVAASAAAFAQPASDYYRGKQIRMIVGHPVGNDYDLGGRFLSKYLAKHIPGNPLIVVSNMPAASSVAAANFLYGQAPRDGTVFGSFSRNIPSQALMRQANLDIDPRRYSWIGGTALPGRVCAAWHTAKVRTPADLLTTELIVGGGGSGSSLSILPTVFNHVLGTKFRVVEGYKGTNDTVIAMERGEVEGVCATYGQFRVHERALKEGKLRLILRAEEAPIAAVPEVPSIYDLAKTDEQRQLMRFVFSSVEFGRPYVLPPDSPPALVALMRKAFADAVNDPDLVAEAERLKLDMTFRPPDDLVKLVDNLYKTPPAIIDTVRKLVPNIQ
jgi:tripartite-type tricarboxylate transporter receptor subunit TctC